MVVGRPSSAAQRLAAQEVEVTHRYTFEIGGQRYVVDIDESGVEMYQVVVDGVKYSVRMANDVDIDPHEPSLQIVAQDTTAPELKEHIIGSEDKTELRAPMPGVVLSVAVQPGDRVSASQQLIVLEAMKMKIPIGSPREGVVAEVVVRETQVVGHDEVLLRFEEA